MKLRANLLLLLAAAIWGLAFVTQRIGMEYVGPFTFTGMRFALGCLTLLPLLLFNKRHSPPDPVAGTDKPANSWRVGLLAGSLMYIAASLQQIGLIYTTAGKAAFITGMYIILVPIAGIFLKHRISAVAWCGSVVALAGLYLLCVKQGFAIAYGDMLVLISAFFWTAHLLLIDRFTRRIDTLMLAFSQFATCAALSLATALCFETITLSALSQAWITILYGGVCSVGIAYTLQFVGQKHASPVHTALILSLETVFAAVGGYFILHELLGWRELIGCMLILGGMLLSQLPNFRSQPNDPMSPAGDNH